MQTIEKSIEVNAPVGKVYNQWTQFETFPEFLEGVRQVKQLDDKTLHWVAEIGGKKKEWDAEIVDQIPDERIAWKSITGTPNSGVVHFHPKSDDRTLLTLKLNYEPESALEIAADAMGLVSGRVESDLERFRKFIEHRPTETGAWRGEVRRGQIRSSGHETEFADQSRGYGNSGHSGLT
jgi:uncharacterized membrane protein